MSPSVLSVTVQCSTSPLHHHVRAFGKVGTHAPSTRSGVPSDVIDVQMGAHHGVDRRRARSRRPSKFARNGPCIMCKNGNVRGLSLPIHVSTTMRAPSASTTRAWMRRTISSASARAQPRNHGIVVERFRRHVGEEQRGRDRRFELDDARTRTAPTFHCSIPVHWHRARPRVRRRAAPIRPVPSGTMPKLLLLDGHSLAYRAFFALPTDLATKAGTVTNAVYGFTSMLTKVLADEQPDYIAVAFDAPGGSTYRYELDPEYKAGRKETPDLFASQLPLIHEVLETLEIRQLEVSGVEADDVIATLATQRGRRGHRRRRRHRRPRLVPARARPARQGPLQQARRLRLRALRRSRHRRALPRRHARAVPRVRGAARRHERQPARRARHRREDGGQARSPPTATSKAIFEHLDELPPKQTPEPRRVQGPRVQEPRDVACSTSTSTCGVESTDLQQGAFDREKVRVLFNQLEFRTLLPRLLDAIGDVAEAPEAETLEVDVVDRARREAPPKPRCSQPRRPSAVALEAAVGRRRRPRARSSGSRSRPTTDVTYIDADLLADATVRDGARRAASAASSRRSSRTAPRS